MSQDDESRLRAEFMERIYEETGGSEWRWVDPEPIGLRIGVEFGAELSLIMDHLVRAGFLERTEHYPEEVQLTEAGVREVKKNRAAVAQAKESETPGFVVNVGRDVYGLQAGTVLSTQNVNVHTAEERSAIEAFLAEFRRQLESLPLSTEQREDAREDLEIAEAQLRRPRPRRAILDAAVFSLREIALGAAGSAAYVGLVELAQHIHA